MLDAFSVELNFGWRGVWVVMPEEFEIGANRILALIGSDYAECWMVLFTDAGKSNDDHKIR